MPNIFFSDWWSLHRGKKTQNFFLIMDGDVMDGDLFIVTVLLPLNSSSRSRRFNSPLRLNQRHFREGIWQVSWHVFRKQLDFAPQTSS